MNSSTNHSCFDIKIYLVCLLQLNDIKFNREKDTESYIKSESIYVYKITHRYYTNVNISNCYSKKINYCYLLIINEFTISIYNII